MASLALYLSFFNAYVRTLLYNMFARLYPRQNPPLRNLRGQTAIITGANSGIGLYIAIGLAKQGATVCLACRSQERGDEAVKFIESQLRNDTNGAVNGEKTPTPGQVFCWKIDIGDMNSVRAFCEKWAARSGANGNTLDMLVHNAGIPEAPVGSRRLNEKGLDTVYVTNVLGSIFMTHLIEPCLSPTARIVFTSSGGHYACPPKILFEPKPPMWLQSGSEHDPNANSLSKLIYKVKQTLGMRQSGMPIYAQTKAHQVILTTIFQEHFDKAPAPYNKRTAHAFAPGFTKSAIFGKFTMDWKTWITDPMYGFLKVTENFIATDTEQGAKTGGWLAAWGGQAGGVPGGAYWENMCKRTSLIDFERGKMGEEEFKKKVGAMWKVWEGDAGFSWDVGV